MRRGAKLLGVAILCGSMTACVGLNPNPSDDLDLYFVDLEAARAMAPEGTPFAQGLRTGYFALTDYEKSTADLSDASHFGRKAVSSARGLNVQPDAVAYRTLGESDASEFTAARARLMAGLEGGGRIKAAPDAARAQVAYDCWLEAVEAKDAPRIDTCKKDFEDAMAAVEKALVSGVDDIYLVFFAFDSSELTPVAATVVDEVVDAWRQGRPARVMLAGHADRAGPESYNLRLSERRARAVAAALTAGGVPADALDVQWFGESNPRVPTPDGQREPQNRRVEITFE
jgi:outer membrane protein OmpA-like peptidoglycan-associated protein